MNNYKLAASSLLFICSAVVCSDSPSSKTFSIARTVRLGKPTTLNYADSDGAQVTDPRDIAPLNPAIATASIKEHCSNGQSILEIAHQYKKHDAYQDSLDPIITDYFSQWRPEPLLRWSASLHHLATTQDEVAALEAKAAKRIRRTTTIRDLVGATIVPNESHVSAKLLLSRLVVVHGLTHVTVYPLIPAERQSECRLS